jgi:lipopolysaccharide export system protein LptA
VRIRCEDASIAADEAVASELVPEKGQWQLRNNIRITVASAVFSADTATFTFAQKALVSGELIGSPATLEDFIAEDNRSVRATAGRILYDNVNRTARTEGGASLAVGTSEVTGCGDIIYDLDRGLVDSVSTCGEPFVIKYVPPRTNDPATVGSPPAP